MMYTGIALLYIYLQTKLQNMGACNSTNYATPVYKRVYVYGAGETQVDGIYRLCKKTKWRHGFPAYQNTQGYYLTYENVGTSKTANGWIIGKLPTAFYGVKSDLSCPPQTGWETFAGLEPQPDIVFTKFDADKLRAKLFRNRIIKRNSIDSYGGSKKTKSNGSNNVPGIDLSNLNVVNEKEPQKTSRSQFTTDRNFNNHHNYNNENKNHQKHVYGYESSSSQQRYPKVIHSPFKPINNKYKKENGNSSSQYYNPAFYNSPIKNPIHYGNNDHFVTDEQQPKNELDERIIETAYAREEREKIQARINDSKEEAERFKKEQEAYLASLNIDNNNKTTISQFR